MLSHFLDKSSSLEFKPVSGMGCHPICPIQRRYDQFALNSASFAFRSMGSSSNTGEDPSMNDRRVRGFGNCLFKQVQLRAGN